MRRLSFVLVFAVTLSACAKADFPVHTQGDAWDERFQATLAYVEQDMQKNGVSGAAVAVVVNGRLQASAGLGMASANGTGTVWPTTLFRVASLSKMVLAATAMTFVEEGRLTLSDPVTNYVPLTLAAGFDPTTIPLTTLLDHTSGVPDLDQLTCPVGAGQLAAYLNAHVEPLWTQPGQVWNYSNRGFSILGWVLETIGGQPFESLVGSRILTPAGMTTATYDVAAAMSVDHAVGSESGKSYDLDAYDCAAQHPPAGIMASVLDYASFAVMLLASGNGVLQPSSVAAMSTVHADTDDAPDGAQGYGYGLQVYQGDNATMLFHGGHLPGFLTALRLFPAQGFAVVIFYNSGDRDPGDAAQQAARIYLGEHITDGPQGVPATSKWDGYAGTYVDTLELGTIRVIFDGFNHLYATNSAPPSGRMLAPDVPLQPLDGDQFNLTLADGNQEAVTFYPSANAPSQWFVTRLGVGARQP